MELKSRKKLKKQLYACNNASEVIRAGLRLLEENERKIACLKTAIEEGLSSGRYENFDAGEHLKQLKASRHNG